MMTLSRRRSGKGHAVLVGLTALFLSSPGGAQPTDYPPLYPEYPPYPTYPPYPEYPPYPTYPESPEDDLPPPYFPIEVMPAPPLEANAAGKSWSWEGRLGTTLVGETNATTFLWSPQVDVGYRLSPRWDLVGTWGWGGLVDSEGLGEALLKAGNPLFAVGYGQTAVTWSWKASAGLTLPIVYIPSGPEGRLYGFLVNHNLGMNGMWNAWLWLRDFIAIPVQGRLTLPLTRCLPVTLVGAMSPLLGVRKQKRDKHLLAQVSVAVDLPAHALIQVSPRLQLVVMPSPSVNRLQSAVAIRASYLVARSRYFVEVLLNLDEPLGMLRGLKRWGLWFGKEGNP